MSEHSQPPFTSKGIRIHWTAVGQLLLWAVPILCGVCVLYLSSVFATQDQLQQTTARFESLPPRVERLEDFRSEQKSQQQATTAQVGIIQQDIASMRATLTALKEESKDNTNRILQRLDSMKNQ